MIVHILYVYSTVASIVWYIRNKISRPQIHDQGSILGQLFSRLVVPQALYFRSTCLVMPKALAQYITLAGM